MSEPVEIPVPWPIEINLSAPAMQYVLDALGHLEEIAYPGTASQRCEIDNFRNLLLNLFERSEPKPENFDLIGG